MIHCNLFKHLKKYRDIYIIADTNIHLLRKCLKYCNSFTTEELKELASNCVGLHNISIFYYSISYF